MSSSMDTAMANEPESIDSGLDESISSDTGLLVEPAWWRLAADLTFTKGTLIPGKSELTVELLGSKDEPLCTQQVPVIAAEEWSQEHASVLTAWVLTPEFVDDLCGVYETPLAKSIVLGVGEMHPDIQAAMGAIPTLDGEAPLNGAYMIALDKPDVLYVYGVAGLAAAYAGGGEVASALPLEDGLWQIEPVYRFSY